MAAVRDGSMERICPEYMDLDMEIPPTHEHKDVVKHTALVVAKCPPRLNVRLLAFFHDIGKPATRKLLDNGDTTFHNHEYVGGKIANKALARMGFDPETVRRVSKMVKMSGRQKDAWNWSDSAVRRFIREAGDDMEDLIAFYECDTTTRHKRRREVIRMKVQAMHSRILRLIEEDEKKAVKPVLSGFMVMERFGLEPGPEVGEAMKLVKDAQAQNPDITEEEALAIVEEKLFYDDDCNG